jgi:ribosomal protein S18 acetylase RimI-like enzyme
MAATEIREARLSDVGAILEVLSDAARWAREVHRHPWPELFQEDIIVTGIGRNEVLVAVREGSVVGTVALEKADPLIWGDRDDALFVHRLAVRTANRGQGIGDALLEAAAKRVCDAGRTYLCLDCPQHNTDLRRYYTMAGFRHWGDRTVQIEDLGDPPEIVEYRATLYERPSKPERAL